MTLLLVVALVVAVGRADATTGPLFDHFELDENLLDDPAGTPDDWQSLFDGSTTDPTLAATTSMPIEDNDSIDSLGTGVLDTSYFHGGGSKDVNDVSSWGYSSNDVAPDKNEILNAFAAGYVADVGNGVDDTIIYFGLDRYSNDGDAATGFWFFKNRITLDGSGGFNGVHAPGDIFVVSDFSGGGVVSTIHVWEWVGGNKQNSLKLLYSTDLPNADPADCTDPAHNDDVCATANKGDEDGVWPFTAKPSALGPGTPVGGYPQGTLLEGGINITQLLPDSDGCFASFMAETRSSTSPTAQLKDFALGDLPLCAPGTELAGSPTQAAPASVHEGESVQLTFTETNDGEGPSQFIGLTNVFVDTDNAECDGSLSDPSGVVADGDTDADGVLDGDEAWVFRCTVTAGSTDMKITAKGFGTFNGGTVVRWCNEAELADPPANVVCDQEEIATAWIDVIEPGTELSISADPTTVRSDDTVTLTITEKNDGTNPGPYFTADSSLDLDSVAVQLQNQGSGCTGPFTAPPDGGDDGDNVLEKGESWTWTCTTTIAATSTITAVATADDIHDHPVTVCADPAPADGTLSNGTVCDSEEAASVDVTVVSPSTILTQGAKVDITYTIFEHNDGDSALSPPNGVQADRADEGWLEVDTDTCANLTYVEGDVGNDHVLSPGENWKWTCTDTLEIPIVVSTNGDGSLTFTPDTSSLDVTNVVIGHGLDVTGTDVTFCTTGTDCDPDERDRVKITVQYLARGAD